jgi:hypothetical protein
MLNLVLQSKWRKQPLPREYDPRLKHAAARAAIAPAGPRNFQSESPADGGKSVSVAFGNSMRPNPVGFVTQRSLRCKV